MMDECDLSDLEDVLKESSVEINKHKIFDANNAWITELYFQKPQKNIIWVIYRIKHLRNYKKTTGSSEDPSLVNNVDELGFVY